MRKTNLVLGLLMVTFFSSAVMADWHAFDASKGPQAAALRSAGTESSFSVDIAIPGVEITEKDGYSFVTIPDAALRMIKDQPELPLVTTSILLPDKGTPEVVLEVKDEVVIDLNSKIAPSKGHLTRDVNIDEIARVEGEAYKTDGLYPSDEYKYELGNPYIMRDVRGAALRICPVKYNPVTNKMHVLTKATIKLAMVPGATGINEKVRTSNTVDSAFSPIYKNLFINFQSDSKSWTDLDETAGRAIIICPDQFADAMAPLQEWRATKGLESKLVKASEIAEGDLTAEAVQAYIKAEYEAGNLTWIMLVGDADTMPTLRGVNENAHSDTCYIKLEGDDHIPDAFICRLSAKTSDDVATQVNRIVSYESNPVTGEAASFYRKGVGIASHEGNPTDYARCEELREPMLAWNFDIVDQHYDKSYYDKVKPEDVQASITEGRSLINYIGHGSKTMWVSSRYSVSHVNQATNSNGMWPMIWSVACVNGDFAFGSDCFAEAWAKAGTPDDPRGAIGIVAATTNMAWVPPCVWQKAIVKDYMIAEVAFTGGAQHHYGMLKACEKYGYSGSGQGIQIVEQCIFFGDSSVTLRNDVPREAVVTVENSGAKNVALKVMANDKPVAGARVVVSTELKGGVVATTDANGVANVDFAQGIAGVEALSVTVTGHNLIPVINEAVELQ